MARKIYVLGIFAMAVACGAFGYQVLTYYFYRHWPSVSFAYVYSEVFGDFPVLRWHWENELLQLIGRLPVWLVFAIFSYSLLLASDMMRGRLRHPAS